MALSIGELFVNLGIKGGDKTMGVLKGVRDGLKGITSTSTETKLALVAALYGLQRLMAQSAQAGTDLVTFSSRTGDSIDFLQKWSYAMTQAGGSAQEMQQSIEGISSAVGAMEAGLDSGGQIASGLARIGQQTGGLDPSQLHNTKYILEKARDYFKTTTDSFGIQEMVRNSLKLGTHFASGSKREIFEDKVFNKAPKYSDVQAEQLNKINIAWVNLWKKIEMGVGQLNAKHGLQIIQDVAKLTDSILALGNSFVTLAEKAHLFDALHGVFKVMGYAIQGFAKILSNLALGEKGPYGDFVKWIKGFVDSVATILNLKDGTAGDSKGKKKGINPEWERAGGVEGEGWLNKPTFGPPEPGGKDVSISDSYNINNEFHIIGGGEGVKKAVEQAATKINKQTYQKSSSSNTALVRQN